jgi:hypothetical protein
LASFRRGNVYKLAENCFQCHTIPNEKLVNTSGHAASSPIELVSWSQGEVRHHFLNGTKNQANTQDWLRSLRRGTYRRSRNTVFVVLLKPPPKRPTESRWRSGSSAAKANLKKLSEVVPNPDIQQILTIADGVALKLNNEAAIMEAAEKISTTGKKIAGDLKGSDLAAVDPLIPPASQYKGPVANP